MKHKLEIELKHTINHLFPALASTADIEIVSNSNKNFGDYSSNIAFKLASKLSVQVKLIAQKIVESWPCNFSQVDIKCCDLGYINFILMPSYKTELFYKLIYIDRLSISIFNKNPQDFKTLKDFRHALVFHTLVNLMQYTNFKDDKYLTNLKVGKCARSLEALEKDFDNFKFSCLATPLNQDWIALDSDSLQTIKYAYQRTHHALDFLGTEVVDKKNLSSTLLCFNQNELNLLNNLIDFEDILFLAITTLNTQLLCKYLKNLARTIHNLYNKITLVNDNANKNFAIRCLLEATQSILTVGLQLLGVDKP